VTDHDHRFKELLHTFLPEFVALFLPEKADRFDWKSVEFRNTELFTSGEQGARRTVDVVAAVRTLAGGAEEILIHVEIEAGPRAEFAERMFEYYCLLRLRDRRRVLPMAVFLRGGMGGLGWMQYEEQVDDDWIAKFRFLRIPLPDIHQETLPPANPVRYALNPLLASRSDDPVQLLVESLRGIAHTLGDEERRLLLGRFVQAYVPLDPGQVQAARQAVAREPEVQEMATLWEELGRAEGRVEGLRSGIQRVLRDRFETLPPDLETRLDQVTDAVLLEDLLIRASRLTTPEALFDDAPPDTDSGRKASD
jgi:hypothetical protein